MKTMKVTASSLNPTQSLTKSWFGWIQTYPITLRTCARPQRLIVRGARKKSGLSRGFLLGQYGFRANAQRSPSDRTYRSRFLLKIGKVSWPKQRKGDHEDA